MILQLKIRSRRERLRLTSHYIGVGSLQGSIFNVFPTHNPHVVFITFNFIRTNFSARYAHHLYDLYNIKPSQDFSIVCLWKISHI